MKAGELQTIRTIAALWGWRYKSRYHDCAHIQNQMEDGVDDLSLWGDDFEVILDILEGDEGVEQQFLATATTEQLQSVRRRKHARSPRESRGLGR